MSSPRKGKESALQAAVDAMGNGLSISNAIVLEDHPQFAKRYLKFDIAAVIIPYVQVPSTEPGEKIWLLKTSDTKSVTNVLEFF